MATTISLEQEVKEKLDLAQIEIENVLKKKITLGEAIDYLIKENKKKR